MFNGRLYRAALVPVLLALAIAGFSLTGRPPALTSTLAPDAFEGRRALADLGNLAAQYPSRRPGSAGDEALAAHVAAVISGLGGTAGGGFAVRTHSFDAQTIDGARTLTTVVAQRPGSTNASPIAIVAHRDAAARGSEAELSGTAALLELARVFADRETKRTILLVSTSGGSGGDAGAAEFASSAHGPFDAVIVLGDLAAARTSPPFVVPYSDGFGAAPAQLQQTLAGAITRETGWQTGAPGAFAQLAHLAFPLAAGEQGVLGDGGLPAVLVAGSGERAPGARASIDGERLSGFGRSVLSAVDALDAAPDISTARQTGIVLQRKTVPAWAIRLLTGTLLLAPLVLVADGLARARRRRLAPGRWVLWTLTCALPFLACALFAVVLGALGIVPAPAVPALARAMPFGGSAVTAVLAVAFTFMLSWLLWGALVRRLRWGARPEPAVAGVSMLLVLLPASAAVWIANPFAALLLLPAVHAWLLVADPQLRPRRPLALALVLLGVLPLALIVAFHAGQLGDGVGGAAWTAVVLLAGGHVGPGGILLWSCVLGCAAAAAMVAAAALPELPPARTDDGVEISIRGPMSYAGPGSLGGTESALRR